jgi:DNA-3-methyladenine glycosylase
VPQQQNPDSFTSAQVREARILSREFFNRDATAVARGLLGKLLVRRDGRRLLAGRVVETEAYLGPDDPAAHAFTGRTARNAVLFGPPGHAYIYFIYGNHFCLNASCMQDGRGEGVLFRAMEPVFGIEAMAKARGLEIEPSTSIAKLRLISSGPGRMAQAMGITRERDNDKDLTSRASDLWLADDGFRAASIVATPRIGITKAAERPLRFVIARNAYVSGKKIE